MNKLTDKLWLGNASDARDLVALSHSSVEAVLNVAKDLDCPSRPGIYSYRVGLIDGPGNPPDMFAAAVACLQALLAAHKSVLVHCHEGRSRSPIVAATVIALSNNLTIEEIIRQFKAIRSVVNPKVELIDLARQYIG